MDVPESDTTLRTAIAGIRYPSVGLDIRGGKRRQNGSWFAIDCILATHNGSCPIAMCLCSQQLLVRFSSCSSIITPKCMLRMQDCSIEGRRTRDEGYESCEKEVDPGT
jgi:hypothetical protein